VTAPTIHDLHPIPSRRLPPGSPAPRRAFPLQCLRQAGPRQTQHSLRALSCTRPSISFGFRILTVARAPAAPPINQSGCWRDCDCSILNCRIISEEYSTTIKYALTRIEIVRFFLRGVKSSPKFLAMILICLVGLGAFTLAMRSAFSRSLTSRDVVIAVAWPAGALIFMLLWLFIRGKTDERTLTVSPDGISTQIGSLKGQIPWSKVKLVTRTNRHVLIVGATGNAFFIPSRAFQGPDQQAKFVTQIDHWRHAV
jgi:YcxB-like protein